MVLRVIEINVKDDFSLKNEVFLSKIERFKKYTSSVTI